MFVNYPTRGARGASWSGNSLSWVATPDEDAAVHFHERDLADAGWNPSFDVELPADLPSGCYGLRLEPVDRSTPEFWVPFIVRPARGAATNDVVYVIPTTTYGAYANMHLRVTAQFNELAHARLTVLDSTDFLLLERPSLGMSTYDVHRDGSPVVYSSMSRPVTNFRPTGRMYKFCLDLMITDWLDAQGSTPTSHRRRPARRARCCARPVSGGDHRLASEYLTPTNTTPSPASRIAAGA